MINKIKTIFSIIVLINAVILGYNDDIYHDKIKVYIDKHLQGEFEILDSNVFTSSDELNQLLDINEAKKISKWLPRATSSDYYQGIFLENYYIIEFDDPKENIISVADHFKKLPVISSVELVPIIQLETIPNDYYWEAMYGLRQINAVNAYSLWDVDNGNIPGNSPSNDVVVGIVDLGLAWNHPDLIDNVWRNLGEDIDGDGDVLEYINGEWVMDPGDTNSIDDDGDGFVDNFVGYDVAYDDNDPYLTNYSMSHGTNVAGCVSGMTNNEIGIASVGWSVKLMGINSGQNSSNISHGYEGILAAAQMGADIINLSWGMSSYFESHETLINLVFHQYNCILVGAAGNYGVNEPHYPASYENVISVTATGSNDQFNCWPNFHETVDISAPGENIWTTTSYSSNGYPYNAVTGTSFSSPTVAGAIALLKSVYPDADNTMIIDKILLSTSYFNDMDGSCGGEDLTGLLGSGQLDIYEAILYPIESNTIISNVNGTCFPGDTNEVAITIRNEEGSPPLDNIIVTLFNNDPRISIIEESVEYNGIVLPEQEFVVHFLISSSSMMSFGDIPFEMLINAMPSANLPANLILDEIDIEHELTIHFGTYQNGYPIDGVSITHVPLVIDLYSSNNSYPRMLMFTSDNIIYGKWISGIDLLGFPYSAGSEITTDLSSGDLDGDGDKEIIFGTQDGTLHALNKDASELFLFSQEYPINQYPSLADLNGSGSLDIVFFSGNDSLSFLYVLDISGDIFPNFPILFSEKVSHGPSIADLNGDGNGNIIFSIGREIYAFDQAGSILNGFPIYGDTTFSTTVTLIDINDDSSIEIVVGDNNGFVYIYNMNGDLIDEYNVEDHISSGISIGDLDQNGELELIFSSGIHTLHSWEFINDQELEGWPINIEDAVYLEPVVVDLNNDLCHDVIYSAINGDISVITCNGEVYENFPYTSNDSGQVLAVIGDLDQDFDYEIVVAGGNSLNVLDISAQTGNAYSWDTYRSNSRRDGVYDISQLSIDQEFVNVNPSAFLLYDNFPNPFNPTTTINFSLSKDMDISLDIYDVKGNNIKTMLKGILDYGSYSLKWNGMDKRGNKVSSGIYFYELRSGELNQIKKMIFLK